MFCKYVWDFTALFDAKYAVVWSGVIGAFIGSFISFVTTLLSNRSNLKQLATKLEHDTNQNREDHKATIRREVYTEVIEEVHAALGAIGGLPERPLSELSKDMDSIQSFIKSSGKVWLVADSEAAHLSRELTALMSEVFSKTLKSATSLRQAMEFVRSLERQAFHAESEILRISSKLAELKERREDQNIIHATADSWKATNDWHNTLVVERNRRVALIRPERLKHANELVEDLRPLRKVIVKFVSALRKELHLPPDEEQFLAELAEMEVSSIGYVEQGLRK
jgi:hypothetical protein